MILAHSLRRDNSARDLRSSSPQRVDRHTGILDQLPAPAAVPCRVRPHRAGTLRAKDPLLLVHLALPVILLPRKATRQAPDGSPFPDSVLVYLVLLALVLPETLLHQVCLRGARHLKDTPSRCPCHSLASPSPRMGRGGFKDLRHHLQRWRNDFSLDSVRFYSLGLFIYPVLD